MGGGGGGAPRKQAPLYMFSQVRIKSRRTSMTARAVKRLAAGHSCLVGFGLIRQKGRVVLSIPLRAVWQMVPQPFKTTFVAIRTGIGRINRC